MPINLFAKDLDEDDAVNEQYQALTYCFFHPSSHGTYAKLSTMISTGTYSRGWYWTLLSQTPVAPTPSLFLALWNHDEKSRTVGPAIPSAWSLIFWLESLFDVDDSRGIRPLDVHISGSAKHW
jgi:hypothetical protein